VSVQAVPDLDQRLEQHRRELTAYCYRMLGSPFEAEDAVQDTFIRAWRGYERFEGRAALRSWLYKIATNVCLDMLKGRERRARPMDLGPAQEPVLELATIRPDETWLQPMPDPADVAIERFLVYFLPLPLVSTLMWFWSRSLFQPRGLLLSWRAVLLEIARWPVVLWALVNVVLRIRRPYMITPKGAGAKRGGPRLLSLYAPYFVLAVIPLSAVWLYQLHSGPLRGYYGLALLNGVCGAALLVSTLVIELRSRHLLRARLVMLAAVALLMVLVLASADMSMHAVSHTLR